MRMIYLTIHRIEHNHKFSSSIQSMGIVDNKEDLLNYVNLINP